MDSEEKINNRKWTTVRPRDDNSHFRIMTYNVLTDLCIKPGQYTYCPEQVRYMASRHVTIMAEVKDMSPDIACFQEVDHNHFINRLEPSMEQLGFHGVLHQRVDDQGLATFWNTNSFELIDQTHSTLHDVAETYLQMTSSNPAQLSAIRQSIRRPEAVLCVLLRHAVTGSQLAVANVHVTWSQLKYPALQTLQIAMAANELFEFASRGEKNKAQTAQVLVGDFNAPPHTTPYHLLSTGRISDVINRSTLALNDSEEWKSDQLLSDGLYNILPESTFSLRTTFKSSYKTVLGVEPLVTNCDDCGGLDGVLVHQLCLDYIWFSERSLDVSGVLETPPSDLITKHYALPSVIFPSDHIPLMAQLHFCNT